MSAYAQDLQKAQSEQEQRLATQERLLAETQHQHDQLWDTTYPLSHDVLSSAGNLQSQIFENARTQVQERAVKDERAVLANSYAIAQDQQNTRGALCVMGVLFYLNRDDRQLELNQE